MPFFVKEPESKLSQVPPGVHAAVCVDVVDMGKQPNRFDPEAAPAPTVRLWWQVGEDDPKTKKPYLVRQDYRASLHEKARLRKDLEAWRGRPFTFTELAGFDLEQVIGACCMLNMVEKAGKNGGKFSNIAGIMPLIKHMAKLEAKDYVRVKDRVTVAMPEHQDQDIPPNAPYDDDDVPF
jgi:hypothetical protein